MRPIRIQWPRTKQNEMVMFVAQLLQSMVAPDSYESFRAFTLDTNARLSELDVMLSDVLQGRIPSAALDVVIQELEWSLDKDRVAKLIANDEVEGFVKALADSKKDLRQFQFHCRYVLNIISPDYIRTAEAEIIRLAQTNKKDQLRRMLTIYAASLINSGISKRHILKIVEETFFLKDTSRLGLQSLSRMFNQIGTGRKNYNVYCPFSSQIANYLGKVLQRDVYAPKDFDPTLLKELRGMPNYKKENNYLQIKVSEYDAFEAARHVDNYFDNFQAITFLARRGVDIDWPEAKYVARPGSKKGVIILNRPLEFQKKTLPSGRVFKNFRTQIDQIYNCFDTSSTERLLNAINTAALARSSQNTENQLISLWSAFEVLLSEPQANQARVIHYVDLLVPSISIRYVRRYIVAISDELSAGYGIRFKRIISQLPDELGIDQYTHFTHLIFDEQYAILQKKLFDLCTENPLACNHIWKLHADFRKADAMMKAVEAYENRVAWQLHRIYRARNNLVHAGKTPTYLESLVMNAFEYFRSCVTSLLFYAKGNTNIDIDASVAEIAVRQSNYKRIVKGMGSEAIALTDFDYIYRR